MSVIMFHSVGAEKLDWPNPYLSIPWQHFDDLCKYFNKKKYRTNFLDRWYEAQDDITQNNKNIYLTFDDGFLDNWVFVYPIIKKYGIKITIFINPEFVQTGETIRPTIETVWKGDIGFDKLEILGFLNWVELIEMQESGLVDIQSHSMSHTWYPTGNKIIDIVTKENLNQYPWVYWNAFPQNKSNYLNQENLQSVVGSFIYENGRSLGIRRYYPDINAKMEEKDYFNKRPKEAEDLSEVNEYIYNKNYFGRMESDEEMYDRYYYELNESKQIIEQKLKKKVNFLCWPGGGYNDLSVFISKKVGYKASTIASWDRNPTLNNRREYKRISRFGISSQITGIKKTYIPKSSKVVINIFRSKANNKIYKNFNRVIRMNYIRKELFHHSKKG